MKKFGTPIAAGPGVASENVGLAGVGAPSLLRSAELLFARACAREDEATHPFGIKVL